MTPTTTLPVPSLREQLEALRRERPHAHMRELAAALSASEGELVASGCGAETVRLDPRWTEFLPALPALGEVMVLTRNDGIVHEKDGRFDHIGFFGSTMAQVVNHDVDLRIFLRHWKHLFAVAQPSHGRVLPSFQVFDAAGRAVHKIYLRPQSDEAAYRDLVARFTHPDQIPVLAVEPLPAPPPPPAVPADPTTLRTRWQAMKDTHDFFPMIRDLGLTRRAANALVGDDFATRLPAAVLEPFLRRAAEQQVPIMVFVGNPGCIQIHTGPIHQIERIGPWLNVLDPGFNLHIRGDLVAEAWLVRKPTADGIVTSVELFDPDGGELALFFGERKPGKTELASWRTLAHSLTAPRVEA